MLGRGDSCERGVRSIMSRSRGDGGLGPSAGRGFSRGAPQSNWKIDIPLDGEAEDAVVRGDEVRASSSSMKRGVTALAAGGSDESAEAAAAAARLPGTAKPPPVRKPPFIGRLRTGVWPQRCSALFVESRPRATTYGRVSSVALDNKTKHIARRHFFVRDMVESFELNVPFVGTADNVADFFTKALDAKTFFRFRNKHPD